MAAIWCHTSQNGEANGDRDWLFEHRVAPWMTEAGPGSAAATRSASAASPSAVPDAVGRGISA